MKVNIQVERSRGAGPTESLNQRYRARAGSLFRITCLLDQMQVDDAVNDPQYLARDQRATGEEKTYGPHPDWNGKLSTH